MNVKSNLVPRVLSYSSPGAREGTSRREPWERGCVKSSVWPLKKTTGITSKRQATFTSNYFCSYYLDWKSLKLDACGCKVSLIIFLNSSLLPGSTPTTAGSFRSSQINAEKKTTLIWQLSLPKTWILTMWLLMRYWYSSVVDSHHGKFKWDQVKWRMIKWRMILAVMNAI